jgi:hypothetical protein
MFQIDWGHAIAATIKFYITATVPFNPKQVESNLKWVSNETK